VEDFMKYDFFYGNKYLWEKRINIISN